MQRLNKSRRFEILQSTLIFFCVFVITRALLSQDLFTDLENVPLSPRQETIFNRLQRAPTTLDVRIVAVNRAFLKERDSINLKLFDKTFAAHTSRLDRRRDDDFTWYGTVAGKWSNLVLSVYKDAVKRVPRRLMRLCTLRG